MSKVFVVDTDRQPLNPVHPGRARILLSSGKAAVLKRYPFTIVLKVAIVDPSINPLRVKIDPGSKTTGLAIVNDETGQVVFAAELSHRGQQVKKRTDDRRAVRRRRRARHTRYRKQRSSNRRNQREDWLSSSLKSRISNIETWVQRLCRVCPIAAISMELVKFDTQKMENPEISGVEYQQGTLAGYEVREYLLEKWNRQCAYCEATGVPLQVEHIHPRAKFGTNRISNLCLACKPCNKAKGAQDIRVFLVGKPEVLKRILAQTKKPLRDAAVMNGIRWTLLERLKSLGLPVECGSGGLTKYNRTTRGLPKTHWIDAACVGKSTPEMLVVQEISPLFIIAKGHGSRKMCSLNKYGFPKCHRQRRKKHFGYQTGDLIRAVVPKGKHQGVHVGRVTARVTGSFDIVTNAGKSQHISYKYCCPIHQSDGYNYQVGRSARRENNEPSHS